MSLNYKKKVIEFKVEYKFHNTLRQIPLMGCFSNNQRKFIVTSVQDTLFVDLDKEILTQREVDIDEQEKVAEIRSMCVKGDKFFVLANKKDKKLGFYMFSLDMETLESEHFISWNNKLDIGDAEIYNMKEF